MVAYYTEGVLHWCIKVMVVQEKSSIQWKLGGRGGRSQCSHACCMKMAVGGVGYARFIKWGGFSLRHVDQ